MASENIDLDEKAFPFYASDGHRGCPGMTLYDYYLGQSLIALAPRKSSIGDMAGAADLLAMELLKVRNKRMSDGKSL